MYTRTCCGTRAGTTLPTPASTCGPCKTILDIEIPNTRCTTRAWPVGGLKVCGSDAQFERNMMVTKVGPMQDSMASGSNPADAQGPGFALTDENQRPLFVFIIETRYGNAAA